MNFFMKGVDLKDPRLTRRKRVWWAYLCWCIQFQMEIHKPYYPGFIRIWAHKHYGGQRYGMSWRAVRQWQSVDPKWKPTKEWTPLPWWLGENALGIFHKPWTRVARWFRSQTLDLSHRAEFTDKQYGALYTGFPDNFMEQYFERFIERIDGKGIDSEEEL